MKKHKLMSFYGLVLACCLLPVSVQPFLINEPSPTVPGVKPGERTAPQKIQEELWSEMTVIKTHYDCRGVPMWREVSKIKSRKEEPVEVIRISKESIDSSSTPETPIFFRSMKSRFRHAEARTQAPSTVLSHSKPSSLGQALLNVGPDRIIDTPIISCPEGYNDDFNGRCRPVFPENI